MHTYAIGDIHGCKDELVTLIRNLRKPRSGFQEDRLEPEDTLVFVGDYVDRGPDSKGVIDALLHLSEYQKCVFLMGNHEDMMLWYLGIDHGNDTTSHQAEEFGGSWMFNGGLKTVSSYGIDLADFHKAGGAGPDLLLEALPDEHLAFLKGLQYFHIEGSSLFVHAGVSRGGVGAKTPEEAVECSTDEHLLWDREAFRWPNKFGTMIYGHTPSKKGVRWLRREEGAPYSVGVDVGCVFGSNPLTAVRTSDWAEFT